MTVLSHLTERHTAAFERGMVFARKYMITQAFGFDLNTANLPEYFGCSHYRQILKR
jgi:hypothetical protein